MVHFTLKFNPSNNTMAKPKAAATATASKPNNNNDSAKPKKRMGFPSLLSKAKGNPFGSRKLASYHDKGKGKKIPPPVRKIKFSPTDDDGKDSTSKAMSSLSDQDALFRLLNQTTVALQTSTAETTKRPPVASDDGANYQFSDQGGDDSSKFLYEHAFAPDADGTKNLTAKAIAANTADQQHLMFEKQSLRPQPPAAVRRPKFEKVQPLTTDQTKKKIMDLDKGLKFMGNSPITLDRVAVQTAVEHSVPPRTNNNKPTFLENKTLATLQAIAPQTVGNTTAAPAAAASPDVVSLELGQDDKEKKIAFEKVKALLSRMNPRASATTAAAAPVAVSATKPLNKRTVSKKSHSEAILANAATPRVNNTMSPGNAAATPRVNNTKMAGVAQAVNLNLDGARKNPTPRMPPGHELIVPFPTPQSPPAATSVTNSLEPPSDPPTSPVTYRTSVDAPDCNALEQVMAPEWKEAFAASAFHAQKMLVTGATLALMPQDTTNDVDVPAAVEDDGTKAVVESDPDDSVVASGVDPAKISPSVKKSKSPQSKFSAEGDRNALEVLKKEFKGPNYKSPKSKKVASPKTKAVKESDADVIMVGENSKPIASPKRPTLTVKTNPFSDSSDDDIPAPAVDAVAMMAALESTLPMRSPVKRKKTVSPRKKVKRKTGSTTLTPPLAEANDTKGNLRRKAELKAEKFKSQQQGQKSSITSQEARLLARQAMEGASKSKKDLRDPPPPETTAEYLSIPIQELVMSADEAISDLDQSLRYFPVHNVVAEGSVDVSRMGETRNDLETVSSEASGDGYVDRYAPLENDYSPRGFAKMFHPEAALADSITEWSIQQEDSEDTGQMGMEVTLNPCQLLIGALAGGKPNRMEKREVVALAGGRHNPDEKRVVGALAGGRPNRIEERAVAAVKTGSPKRKLPDNTPRASNKAKPSHFFADKDGDDLFSADKWTTAPVPKEPLGRVPVPSADEQSQVLARKEPDGQEFSHNGDDPTVADGEDASLEIYHASSEIDRYQALEESPKRRRQGAKKSHFDPPIALDTIPEQHADLKMMSSDQLAGEQNRSLVNKVVKFGEDMLCLTPDSKQEVLGHMKDLSPTSKRLLVEAVLKAKKESEDTIEGDKAIPTDLDSLDRSIKEWSIGSMLEVSFDERSLQNKPSDEFLTMLMAEPMTPPRPNESKLDLIDLTDVESYTDLDQQEGEAVWLFDVSPKNKVDDSGKTISKSAEGKIVSQRCSYDSPVSPRLSALESVMDFASKLLQSPIKGNGKEALVVVQGVDITEDKANEIRALRSSESNPIDLTDMSLSSGASGSNVETQEASSKDSSVAPSCLLESSSNNPSGLVETCEKSNESANVAVVADTALNKTDEFDDTGTDDLAETREQSDGTAVVDTVLNKTDRVDNIDLVETREINGSPAVLGRVKGAGFADTEDIELELSGVEQQLKQRSDEAVSGASNVTKDTEPNATRELINELINESETVALGKSSAIKKTAKKLEVETEATQLRSSAPSTTDVKVSTVATPMKRDFLDALFEGTEVLLCGHRNDIVVQDVAVTQVQDSKPPQASDASSFGDESSTSSASVAENQIVPYQVRDIVVSESKDNSVIIGKAAASAIGAGLLDGILEGTKDIHSFDDADEYENFVAANRRSNGTLLCGEGKTHSEASHVPEKDFFDYIEASVVGQGFLSGNDVYTDSAANSISTRGNANAGESVSTRGNANAGDSVSNRGNANAGESVSTRGIVNAAPNSARGKPPSPEDRHLSKVVDNIVKDSHLSISPPQDASDKPFARALDIQQVTETTNTQISTVPTGDIVAGSVLARAATHYDVLDFICEGTESVVCGSEKKKEVVEANSGTEAVVYGSEKEIKIGKADSAQSVQSQRSETTAGLKEEDNNRRNSLPVSSIIVGGVGGMVGSTLAHEVFVSKNENKSQAVRSSPSFAPKPEIAPVRSVPRSTLEKNAARHAPTPETVLTRGIAASTPAGGESGVLALFFDENTPSVEEPTKTVEIKECRATPSVGSALGVAAAAVTGAFVGNAMRSNSNRTQGQHDAQSTTPVSHQTSETNSILCTPTSPQTTNHGKGTSNSNHDTATSPLALAAAAATGVSVGSSMKGNSDQGQGGNTAPTESRSSVLEIKTEAKANTESTPIKNVAGAGLTVAGAVAAGAIVASAIGSEPGDSNDESDKEKKGRSDGNDEMSERALANNESPWLPFFCANHDEVSEASNAEKKPLTDPESKVQRESSLFWAPWSTTRDERSVAGGVATSDTITVAPVVDVLLSNNDSEIEPSSSSADVASNNDAEIEASSSSADVALHAKETELPQATSQLNDEMLMKAQRNSQLQVVAAAGVTTVAATALARRRSRSSSRSRSKHGDKTWDPSTIETTSLRSQSKSARLRTRNATIPQEISIKKEAGDSQQESGSKTCASSSNASSDSNRQIPSEIDVSTTPQIKSTTTTSRYSPGPQIPKSSGMSMKRSGVVLVPLETNFSVDTKADQADQAASRSGALPTTPGGASERHEAMLCRFGSASGEEPLDAPPSLATSVPPSVASKANSVGSIATAQRALTSARFGSGSGEEPLFSPPERGYSSDQDAVSPANRAVKNTPISINSPSNSARSSAIIDRIVEEGQEEVLSLSDVDETSLLLALTRSDSDAGGKSGVPVRDVALWGAVALSASAVIESSVAPSEAPRQNEATQSDQHRGIDSISETASGRPSSPTQTVSTAETVPDSVTIRTTRTGKEFARSSRLQTVLDRLRTRNGTGDCESLGSDPVNVNELFSRYDNIVKHMVVYDEGRLQQRVQNDSPLPESIIDVTDLSDPSSSRSTDGMSVEETPPTGSRRRSAPSYLQVHRTSSSVSQDSTTPSQKARNLRFQLDQALKTSSMIRSSQERLGAELSTFKSKMQEKRRSVSPGRSIVSPRNAFPAKARLSPSPRTFVPPTSPTKARLESLAPSRRTFVPPTQRESENVKNTGSFDEVADTFDMLAVAKRNQQQRSVSPSNTEESSNTEAIRKIRESAGKALLDTKSSGEISEDNIYLEEERITRAIAGDNSDDESQLNHLESIITNLHDAKAQKRQVTSQRIQDAKRLVQVPASTSPVNFDEGL